MKEENLCDCKGGKSRLVYACCECVPTSNFPKGVRRAKELLKRYEMLDKEYQTVVDGCAKSGED